MLPFLIIAEKKKKQQSFIVYAVFIMLFSSVLLSLINIQNSWILLLGVFIYFISFNFLEANLPSLTSKLAPKNSKGLIMGIYSFFQFIGAAVGGITTGFAAQYIGIKGPLFLCNVIIIFWLIAIFLITLKCKDRKKTFFSKNFSDNKYNISKNDS